MSTNNNLVVFNGVSVAYLAPEIPALSATFVYEELYALERCGFHVFPFSVHAPKTKAVGELELSERVDVIYKKDKLLFFINGLFLMFFQPGFFKAFSWLFVDFFKISPWSLSAWKLLYQFSASARLADKLRKNNCKHLHVHFAHVPTQIGMYAAAMAGIQFTVMAHANDIFERGLLLREKAERSKKFITISDFNRRYLEEIGLPKDKLAVVRCGVSFSTPDSFSRSGNKSHYRIGTLGRFVEKKGIDILLEALPKISNPSFLVDVSIAGDGPLANEFCTHVEALGVSDRVTFVGSLAHGDVARWMQELDVFVLACKVDKNGDMDGIPVVLMEAMSQGVPVVSTKLSGIPELIIDGETGLLAEPGNSQDLAEKITELLIDAERRNRFVVAAAKHVHMEFGQEVNIKRLIKIFGF